MTCGTCGETVDVLSGNTKMCKPCRATYDRARYAASRERRRKQIIDSSKIRRARNQAFVLEYLGVHPCVDCGEADPVVLEFDHVQGAKDGNIADQLSSWSLARLLREIEKCEVCCANCHRRRTAKRGGHYRITHSGIV